MNVDVCRTRVPGCSEQNLQCEMLYGSLTSTALDHSRLSEAKLLGKQTGLLLDLGQIITV